MLPPPHGEHDGIICQRRRHGVGAAGEGFAQDQNVGPRAVVVAREHAPRAAQPGLHLVRDEERVVFFQHGVARRQVAVVGDDDAGLALDRFNHKRDDAPAPRLERRPQRRHVVVRHVLKPGHERAKAAGRFWVGRGRDGGERAAPKIAARKQDDGLILGHALDIVAPAAGEFNRGFAGLHAGVHRQDLGGARGGRSVRRRSLHPSPPLPTLSPSLCRSRTAS